MKRKAIQWLDNKITDDITKAELDIIEFCKKCVRLFEVEEKEDTSMLVEVLDYLNEKAGTKYKPVESNLKFIRARLKDYSVADLKAVVDRQVAKWNGTSMQMYLRPETLFNATKFETYHNGLDNKKENKHNFTQREYSQEYLNSLFDNVDEIEM